MVTDTEEEPDIHGFVTEGVKALCHPIIRTLFVGM